MGGAKQTGSVLFLDLAQQQGKVISVESGDESGIAAVSADGQYIVTCAGGDSPSGTLRAYQVSDGTKVADETYTMDANCKPYEIWVIGHSAYAALGTDDGYASHKRLTFREEYMMKLELESITKFYGKYPALQNVSATLTEGVYGLLGPNGAGKTTLINILIGILPASGGVIHLDGENTVQMGGRYFDRIGYMPQYPQFYANFTVQEFLDYMCQVKGVANAKESIDSALVFVNLEENRSKRIGDAVRWDEAAAGDRPRLF